MTDKRVIIIGATSGIGREVARLYIEAGCIVGIAGRRRELLDELVQLRPQRVFAETIDITKSDAPERLHNLIGRCGGMDLYFHSSGIGHNNPTLDIEPELRTIETNCLGFTRMVDTAFNYFVEHGGGHIAAVSSIAGTRGMGAAVAYSSSKRFQNTVLSALKQQSAIRRVPVAITDIRPGFVRTALIEGGHYPMQMDVKYAARKIFRATERRRRVAIIDWRYAVLVAVWRLVPRFVWERWRIA